jgi:glycosyltransferase involved in cell wall biosynthesis
VVKSVVFAVPGDLATPTGGYAYDRHIVAELSALGWRTEVVDLGDGFPHPSADVRGAAGARLTVLPSGAPIVVDGLAFGVLPEVGAAMRASHQLVALVHHPLALEAGLTADEAARLRDSERAALASARHVIVTSPSTAQLVVGDFGVPAERVSVVEPGIAPRAPRIRLREGPMALLAVGAVVPRKGYDVLIAALATLTHLDWHLVIAGDGGRSPATAHELEADIARRGLTSRVALRGAVDESALATLYAEADLFVLPSRFEGYGMAYAEAIAHGLPVVGTTAGAIPQTVPPQAGILVPSDDVTALADALRRLIEDPREYARLAAGARAATFPSWREQATRFAAVLERLSDPSNDPP